MGYLGTSSNLSFSFSVFYFHKHFLLFPHWSIYSLSRCYTVSEFLGICIHSIHGKIYSHLISLWRRTLFKIPPHILSEGHYWLCCIISPCKTFLFRESLRNARLLLIKEVQGKIQTQHPSRGPCCYLSAINSKWGSWRHSLRDLPVLNEWFALPQAFHCP